MVPPPWLPQPSLGPRFPQPSWCPRFPPVPFFPGPHASPCKFPIQYDHFPTQKRPYLHTCKTNIIFDYRIRKLSPRSTARIPLALSTKHHMLQRIDMCCKYIIHMYIYTYMYRHNTYIYIYMMYEQISTYKYKKKQNKKKNIYIYVICVYK